MAENSVIDIRIQEVVRALLPLEDIVEFDPLEFDAKLLAKVNEILQDRGVQLSFISFVPDPDEHTAEAIDVATAMKIYELKGLAEEGREIIKARAGATRVTTNVEQPKEQREE